MELVSVMLNVCAPWGSMNVSLDDKKLRHAPNYTKRSNITHSRELYGYSLARPNNRPTTFYYSLASARLPTSHTASAPSASAADTACVAYTASRRSE